LTELDPALTERMIFMVIYLGQEREEAGNKLRCGCVGDTDPRGFLAVRQGGVVTESPT
jgi:hypothetical protein